MHIFLGFHQTQIFSCDPSFPSFVPFDFLHSTPSPVLLPRSSLSWSRRSLCSFFKNVFDLVGLRRFVGPRPHRSILVSQHLFNLFSFFFLLLGVSLGALLACAGEVKSRERSAPAGVPTKGSTWLKTSTNANGSIALLNCCTMWLLKPSNFGKRSKPCPNMLMATGKRANK